MKGYKMKISKVLWVLVLLIACFFSSISLAAPVLFEADVAPAFTISESATLLFTGVSLIGFAGILRRKIQPEQ